MATFNDLLADLFGRIQGTVHAVVGSLSDEQLAARVAPDANTVAWLAWHLTRITDAQVAAATDTEQVWTSGGWADRFALPFDARATGFGQSTADVGRVDVPGELLLGYHDAVHDAVQEVVAGLTRDDLDRVVDRRWDPPVTLAVRLVSIVDDAIQHAGQAAYAAGILRAR